MLDEDLNPPILPNCQKMLQGTLQEFMESQQKNQPLLDVELVPERHDGNLGAILRQSITRSLLHIYSHIPPETPPPPFPLPQQPPLVGEVPDVLPVDCACGSKSIALEGNTVMWRVRCHTCGYSSKPQQRESWSVAKWNSEIKDIKAGKR